MKSFEGKDLLFIDKMITPTIINIIYWLLGVIVVLMGLAGLFTGKPVSILIIPFGLLYVRIMCEVFVVLFKISNNVERIARIAEGKSADVEN